MRSLSPHFVAMAMVLDNFHFVSKVVKLRNKIERLAQTIVVGKKDKKTKKYKPLEKRPQTRLLMQKLKKVDALNHSSSRLSLGLLCGFPESGC